MTARCTLILVASKMPLIPYIPAQVAQGCTHFCESDVHLIIHDHSFREFAAMVGELLYHLQSLSLDGDVGFVTWFSRCWLVHYFYLFLCLWLGQNCHRLLRTCQQLFCMLALVVAFSAQSLANRNLLTISVSTFVFA